MLLPLILATAPNRTAADAIVTNRAMMASTIAEVFVQEGRVTLRLEIAVRDLAAFANILPDELYAKLNKPPRPQAERIAEFCAEDFVLQADGGSPLQGSLTRLEPRKRIQRDEITGEPLQPQPGDAPLVVVAELEYPVETRPTKVSMTPPRSDIGGVAAQIGFLAWHQGLPVNDFRYLGTTETLALDWTDPWYSRFENRNLKRQFDAPLSVFLYVEHFEVRKEIVVRPRDLEHWVDLGLGDQTTLPVDAQDQLKQRVAEFLLDKNPVTIDGKTVTPVLDRVHFIRRSLRRTGVVDPPEPLDLVSATLGVIYVYPIEQLPQEVEMRWELFSPRITSFPSVASDEAGGLPTTVSQEDPILKWQNFLTNPTVPAMLAIPEPPPVPTLAIPVLAISGAVVAITGLWLQRRSKKAGNKQRLGIGGILCVAGAVCIGLGIPFGHTTVDRPFAQRPMLSPERTDELTLSLIHNVYRAFDRRDESLVYDRLATSISGDLLRDVYLQVRSSMELESQGGARVSVQDVALLENTRENSSEDGGFTTRCHWRATGSVGHWGHIHQRATEYVALLTIKPHGRSWKITGLEVVDGGRVELAAR